MSTQPPKPYNLTDPKEKKWTDDAYDLLESGDLTASIESAPGVEIARVDGKCPYCEDTIHCVEILTAYTEGTKGTLGGDVEKAAEKARYRPITVTCGCNVAHPDDPKKGTGCGTTFRVEVLVK